VATLTSASVAEASLLDTNVPDVSATAAKTPIRKLPLILIGAAGLALGIAESGGVDSSTSSKEIDLSTSLAQLMPLTPGSYSKVGASELQRVPQQDHAYRACRCAGLEKLNRTWAEQGRCQIAIGIGLI
jgi:hypothetical protein